MLSQRGLGAFTATRSAQIRSRKVPSHPRGLQLHGAEMLGGFCAKTLERNSRFDSSLCPEAVQMLPGPATFPGFRLGERVLPGTGRPLSSGSSTLPRARPVWASGLDRGWAGRAPPAQTLTPRCIWGSGSRPDHRGRLRLQALPPGSSHQGALSLCTFCLGKGPQAILGLGTRYLFVFFCFVLNARNCHTHVCLRLE